MDILIESQEQVSRCSEIEGVYEEVNKELY